MHLAAVDRDDESDADPGEDLPQRVREPDATEPERRPALRQVGFDNVATPKTYGTDMSIPPSITTIVCPVAAMPG